MNFLKFNKNNYIFLAVISLIILFTVFVLHLEGHTLISQTGKIYLWWGGQGIENSQQLSDWYSFSHFLHGIIFFFLLNYVFQKRNYAKLLIAIVLESSWEILENSPLIINRYREGALAAGYFGDSILNSLSDISFMVLGFLFAYKTSLKFGWKISLIVFIIFELFTLYFIRDNLTLNIIMLLHPLEVISSWQMGL